MNNDGMTLKIMLPYEVFMEKTDIVRLVVESKEGSFGLLPHRLDCAAALSPGILTCETAGEGEFYVALDEGILVKTGTNVLISVRNAYSGLDLGNLREAVEGEFMSLDEREESVRSVLAKLEGEFIRRLTEVRHE